MLTLQNLALMPWKKSLMENSKLGAVNWAVRGILENFQFAYEMGKREFRGQYKGSFIGIGWQALKPLLTAATWIFAVVFIFQVKLGAGQGPLYYSTYVLSGMFVWVFLQRSLEEAPALFVSRMEIVKQALYPVETLPITAALVNAAGPIVNIIVCMVLAGFAGILSISIMFLPLALLIILVFVVGASWGLMIAGVAIRDLRDAIGVLMGAMIFVSPVFLTQDMVGDKYWFIIQLNPLSHFVFIVRDCFFGEFHAISWILSSGISASVVVLGAIILYQMRLRIIEYL
ncbi:ABC transporter permease [Rhodospirillales bacterium]|nr:ABC transporter permease [Rhodospirillales bacterium]